MNRFWRDPPAEARPQPVVTTLAHLGGADAADFSRTETRELFLAISAALRGGATTQLEVLAALPPHLRAYAEWIAAADAQVEMDAPEVTHRRATEAVAALRMLSARRELVDLQTRLHDTPTDTDAARRVGALVAYVHEAGRFAPRAEMLSRAVLRRESGALPARVPLEELRRAVDAVPARRTLKAEGEVAS